MFRHLLTVFRAVAMVAIASTAASALATTLTWTGASSSDWNDPSNWSPQQVPTNGDHAIINSGVLTVATNARFAVLDVNGGSVGGSLSVASNGVVNWTGGIIFGALTVASQGTLNITGDSLKECLGTLTNAGTVVWTGNGNLNLGDNAGGQGWQWGSIYNVAGGLFDIQNDRTFSSYSNPGSARFNNAGTLRKSVGSGTTTFSFYVGFDNSGVVDVQSGVLEFDGGGLVGGQYTTATGASINLANGGFSGFTQVGTPTFSGGGQSQFTGNTLTLVSDMIPGLVLAGGTVYLEPTFQGGSITNLTLTAATLAGNSVVTGMATLGNGDNGTLSVASNGVVNWTGGIIFGALTVASQGTLNITGDSLKECLGTLTNAGTVVWTGNGNLNLGDNAGGLGWQWGSIYNVAGGLFDIQNDRTFSSYSNPGSARFNNAGTLRKSVGSGTTTFSFYVGFDNSGVVDVQSGVLEFDGGCNVSPSSTLSVSLGGETPGTGYGQIVFSGSVALAGDFSVNTRNGFVPNPGDTFQVLSFASATNAFDCMGGLDLGGGILLQPQFGPTGMSLSTTSYTTTSGPPRLLISASPSGVLLTWPLGYPAWTLQSTTNLVSHVWQPVAVQCGNQAVVPATLPQQYFRLVKTN